MPAKTNHHRYKATMTEHQFQVLESYAESNNLSINRVILMALSQAIPDFDHQALPAHGGDRSQAKEKNKESL